jgi:hypothetical protein
MGQPNLLGIGTGTIHLKARAYNEDERFLANNRRSTLTNRLLSSEDGPGHLLRAVCSRARP